jgi:cation diffusion facilitator family transporter
MQHPERTAHHDPSHDEVAQTTRRTLLLNIALSAGKLFLGLAGQSQTLVADAVHSLSDCVTDIGILIGVRYWSAPADERHPYGHWRLEALVTIAMGLSLLAVAVGLVLHAWQVFKAGEGVTPAWYTFFAAATTVVVKESMYRWTQHKARKLRSRALSANAWHQRSDALSSLPAAVAIGAAMIFPDLRFIDPIGAAIVSVFILFSAIRIISGALAELMDESLPPDQRQAIEDIVCQTEGVTTVHALRSRRNGPGFHLDLHVLVPGELTVREGHNIARNVRQALVQSEHHVLDAIVHVEPDDE